LGNFKRISPTVRGLQNGPALTKYLRATSGIANGYLTVQLILNKHRILALIDSGAQANFISPRTINEYGLPWVHKEVYYRLRTVEGEPVEYGNGVVTMETAPLHMTAGPITDTMVFDITEIGDQAVILGLPWLQKYNPRIDWVTGQLLWDKTNPQYDSSMPDRGKIGTPSEPRRDLVTVRPQQQQGTNKPTTPQKMQIYLRMATSENAERIASVPEEYRQYKALFQEELKNGLPEHSQWDHEIPLKPDAKLHYNKLIPLNEEQLTALREHLDKELRKGIIRPSTSPIGHAAFFVPKKNGKLRLVVDFRPLNEATIKNRYPLPLISELQDRLGKAQWFTALDLKGAFNLIRMKAGEEWKTAFRTRYGHYEYCAMPMGLTNAPATFQTMINNVLREYLDHFVVAYLDDLLIYSETLEEHKKHVHTILQTLQQAKLLVEPEKAIWHAKEVDFLGYTIKPGKIEMQASKVAALKDWPQPTTVKEVQAFLGFANYYRKFIKDFGRIGRPLTDLTKKENPFAWSNEAQAAFEEIRDRILSKPILQMPNPDKPFFVETDASDFALGGQLGQKDDQGQIHPVAFYSKKLHGPELNYQIHDKELMAIIQALKEWKPYLSGAKYQVTVYTDHKNLATFTTKKELNKRQIRWQEFLSEFDIRIEYRPGNENGRADALSRREDLREEIQPETQAILSINTDGSMGIVKGLNATYKEELDPHWNDQIVKAYATDSYLTDWKKNRLLTKGEVFYQYKGKIYVPNGLQHLLCKELHESPAHGHQGVTRTLERIKRNYDFPKLRQIIEEVIRTCDICQRSKASRHKPYGELQPLPIPEEAWSSIALDFVVKLPGSVEPLTGVIYDSILVITERLTKYGYFVPYKEAQPKNSPTHSNEL
jgi:hypothetical protein